MDLWKTVNLSISQELGMFLNNRIAILFVLLVRNKNRQGANTTNRAKYLILILSCKYPIYLLGVRFRTS